MKQVICMTWGTLYGPEYVNRLYRNYARGCDLRNLEAIVGREGLSKKDRKFLDYAERFERDFIHQNEDERRLVGESLDIGIRLNALLDEEPAP